jgi:EAL domain-containing protein (putative c-di-GMP-specific phosphodiesterase class I)/CheY-like chemotaxis protein
MRVPMPQNVSTAQRVLVVDDDEIQREVLGAQLQSLGWNDQVFAGSGSEALDTLATHGAAIQLLISDLSMPDMDGLVLMRHLVEKNFKSPIILISGVHDEILSSAATLAGAHGLDILGVLRKPSPPEALAQLLDQLKDHASPATRRAQEQVLTAGRLTQALHHQEFVPWYQPKVDLATGRAVGVEVLARWPASGTPALGPAQFIPALEAAELIDRLFFDLAQQAARDLARWTQMGLALKVAINLSMDTAHQLDLPERLESITREAGVRPSDFVVEVTESRLMMDRSMAMETITRLSMMGFVLSIDDFGTGYSSLVQLIDLPFRELKIDSGFVQRSDNERKARAIVRIAILLGQQLNIKVIAEGVETPAQLDFVRISGCHQVQGYYFARPMPFAACTDWLLNQALP